MTGITREPPRDRRHRGNTVRFPRNTRCSRRGRFVTLRTPPLDPRRPARTRTGMPGRRGVTTGTGGMVGHAAFGCPPLPASSSFALPRAGRPRIRRAGRRILPPPGDRNSRAFSAGAGDPGKPPSGDTGRLGVKSRRRTHTAQRGHGRRGRASPARTRQLTSQA
ncbi:hypothetical protein SBRY_70158 [Actinacidiphila bryophytorum]|uniref:Uncharacterized protein n=1 Tax=Actinacidiphila bryophytorum TaxID=1436133 RepID=A0A9W4MKK8_9ACTN|nr:hypothetical protein SBRY_70158 [Actinacidiphila bryophytorum]